MNKLEDFLVRKKHLVVSIICIVIIILISFSSTIPFKTSDALGSLLTAESILNHGTIKLDAYKGKIDLYTWQIKEKNGHLYYIFPIGNSLCALPFVGITKLVKMRLTRFEDEIKLQKGMSAITVVLTFILILLICSCYLDFPISLLLSSIFLFGSSLMSTMGVAYWSHNTTVIFTLLSLYIITNYETGRREQLNPYLLGFLLFLAFLCRPIAAVFIIFVLIYVWISCRRIFLKLAMTSVLFFSIFIGFSLLEYNQVLPDYYLPSRIGGTNFFSNLYGCLLSPTRGLLVYSPFLIVLPFLVFFLLYKRRGSIKSFTLLAFGWFVIHLLVIGDFSHWWGGGGFGPRILTDAIPPLILMAVLAWSEVQRSLDLNKRKFIIVVCIILAIPSVYINSYTALFNETVPVWNDDAFYDRFPEYLYSWRFPPFAATSELMARRDKEIRMKYPPIFLIEDICYQRDGQQEIASYKSLDQFGTNVWRSLKGVSTETSFQVDLSEVADNEQLDLEMQLRKNSEKKIQVFLNGKKIGIMPRGTHDHSTVYAFTVRTNLLEEVNILRFEPTPRKKKDVEEHLVRINVRTFRFVNESF
jgi:hypothetical protein